MIFMIFHDFVSGNREFAIPCLIYFVGYAAVHTAPHAMAGYRHQRTPHPGPCSSSNHDIWRGSKSVTNLSRVWAGKVAKMRHQILAKRRVSRGQPFSQNTS